VEQFKLYAASLTSAERFALIPPILVNSNARSPQSEIFTRHVLDAVLEKGA
jgi:hypothetical protein